MVVKDAGGSDGMRLEYVPGTLLYPKQLEAIRRRYPLTDQFKQMLMVKEEITPGCDLNPGWFIGAQLYVWCEQHFRWNEHGYMPGVKFQYRSAHCDCCYPIKDSHKSSICIVVIGEATGKLRKQLLNHPIKNVHTPPDDYRVVVTLKHLKKWGVKECLHAKQARTEL
ncbi:MAG: hypothetical protein WBM24_08595 [Candidatus Sulfotelmatobacter sp.]